MSTELSTYLKTTEKLLSNIRAEASKTSCGLNGGESSSASIEKTSSAFVGSMNEAIGFSNFATSGRFYIDLALKSEIPAGITRDHEQLGKEIDRIKNTMEIVYNICAGDLIPMSNLSEDPVYNTTGKTL